MSAAAVRHIHDLIGAFEAARIYDDHDLARRHVDSIILALGDEHDHWMTMSQLLDMVIEQKRLEAS